MPHLFKNSLNIIMILTNNVNIVRNYEFLKKYIADFLET